MGFLSFLTNLIPGLSTVKIFAWLKNNLVWIIGIVVLSIIVFSIFHHLSNTFDKLDKANQTIGQNKVQLKVDKEQIDTLGKTVEQQKQGQEINNKHEEISDKNQAAAKKESVIRSEKFDKKIDIIKRDPQEKPADKSNLIAKTVIEDVWLSFCGLKQVADMPQCLALKGDAK